MSHDNEDERARRFVERHFPETTRFLRSENPDTPLLPAFGPTEVFGGVDDMQPAVAVVRLAMALTRDQLATALGIAFAEMAEGPAEDLTDEQVRNEIELHLASEAYHAIDQQMERDAHRQWSAETRRVLDVLAAKVDQAFAAPQPESERRMQNPEYGPGTVTVDTLDHGRVTMPEPAWCTGHDELQAQARVDTCHFSAETAAEYAGTEFLPVCFSQAPFSTVQPQVMGDIADFPGMSPDEMRDLAAEVAAHSGRLYSKANELDRIRRRQA